MIQGGDASNQLDRALRLIYTTNSYGRAVVGDAPVRPMSFYCLLQHGFREPEETAL